MSGIFGIFSQGGMTVVKDKLDDMSCVLRRRGPDRVGTWLSDSIGLGHCLLATTPEAAAEEMPMTDSGSGCVITADARLDNRRDLIHALGISEQAGVVGDARLILSAFLAWGTDCVEHLLGDFAFAIWDPRVKTLFCARDQFGMRPFYYHHSAGKFLAFASEPRAILLLPQVPYNINERRIADFLIGHLEGVDKTSTFFDDVFRLPPAHSISVTKEQMRLRQYWRLEAGDELSLSSDEAYAEAFLDVFTQAISDRLRSNGRVGSMLSGGMDSGSVVAVASKMLAQRHKACLQTFSAIASDSITCVETAHIQQTLTLNGLEPTVVDFQRLDEYLPLLDEMSWELDDPFDYHMNLQRAVYCSAHREGVNALLDGVGGDIVLSAGSYVARLIRHWRWITAYREIRAQKVYGGQLPPVWNMFGKNVCLAYLPAQLWQVRREFLKKRRARIILEEWIGKTIISPSFAHSESLADRLRTLDEYDPAGLVSDYGKERAGGILHPYLTVGRERYDRVGASFAIEPRDPFLDLRVVSLSVRLPSEQKFSGGWSKLVLRRAMQYLLPEKVRYRRGREHLGWSFTTAFMNRNRERINAELETNQELLRPFIDSAKLQQVKNSYFDREELTHADDVLKAAHLGRWLSTNKIRPTIHR